jgi:peroxiredoxin
MGTIAKALGDQFDVKSLKRIYPMAPELESIDAWINSRGLALSDLRGKVVAIHFYAAECHNCHANLPIYNELATEFAEQDFVMIGIHTPEVASERVLANVERRAEEYKINYPVAIDSQSATWKAWSNTMWPTIYLIDKEGYLRYWWQGELKWEGATGDEVVKSNIRGLLAE